MPALASPAKPRRGVRSRPATRSRPVEPLQVINPHAAGIDVGAASHYVAVGEGADPSGNVTVREFPSFTCDLHDMVQWLKSCQVDTVAMESTGVYWIPLFDLMASEGLKPILVDARRTKNVTGRKSDVADCEWIRKLHSYGLLQGAFRPSPAIVPLRSMVRQRARLISLAGNTTLRMQKSLNLMNLQLQHVLSDVTGVTGKTIMRSIVAGEVDPVQLAKARDRRCKSSPETIAKALEGNYLPEHVLALEMSLAQWDLLNSQADRCSTWIHKHLEQIAPGTSAPAQLPRNKARSKHTAPEAAKDDLRIHLFRLTQGVDLTTVPGISDQSALVILSEIGPSVDAFPSARHFGSWLGLSPHNKISGGKVLSSKTRRNHSPAALAFRLCAQSLEHHKGALGDSFRRLCFRLGKPAALTAMAHKLARIVYSMLKHKTQYVDPEGTPTDLKAQARSLRKLSSTARKNGYQLVPLSPQEMQHQEPAQAPGVT